MKKLRIEIIIYIGLIALGILFVLSFLSCSEERLDIEPDCNCELQTRKLNVVTVGGLPRVEVTTTITDYPVNDCNLDGFSVNNNKTIVCY